MKFVPDASTVKRALSAHGEIGLVAGALLYLICLTGTVLVFYEEWQRIEQPVAPEMAGIEPDAVQAAVEGALESEAHLPKTTHLYVHLPVEDLPRATVTTDHQAFHVDQSGRRVMDEEIAWSDFLYGLHYTLNLPFIVGMPIVGALGVMILVLAVSGVIAHPRIFRDAFRLRARDGGIIGLTDWHNRLSVWTLPFSVAVALTGALIGLSSITATGLAARYYAGDTEAVFGSIFGEHAAPDPSPAPVPNVARALRYMDANFPDVEVTYVVLHDPQTAGQQMQISAEHSRRLIFGEYYIFNAEGEFIETVGMADGEVGKQAAASTYNLHFGSFGGLPVKIAYFIFGLALSAICALGVYIWLRKRRSKGVVEPRLLAAWDAVVWGTPLMLAVTFVARVVFGNNVPVTAIFWFGLIVICAGAPMLAAPSRGRKVLQGLLVTTSSLGLLLIL